MPFLSADTNELLNAVPEPALKPDTPPKSAKPTDESSKAAVPVRPPQSDEKKSVEKKSDEKTGEKKSGEKNADKKKSAKKSSSFAKAVAKRREEIAGLSIVVISTLLLFAVFSYSPQDDAVMENLSFFDLFRADTRDRAELLVNPLGLIGALVSGFLMRGVLGYPTALIIVAAGVWGWNLFRRRGQDGFERASYFTVYAVLFATLTSAMFGLTTFGFSMVMSGAIGKLIATVLKTAVGGVGAWSVVVLLMLIVIVLLIDLDVQKTLDRLLYLFRNTASETKMRFQDWQEQRRAKRNALRLARALADAESEPVDAESGDEMVENVNSSGQEACSVPASEPVEQQPEPFVTEAEVQRRIDEAQQKADAESAEAAAKLSEEASRLRAAQEREREAALAQKENSKPETQPTAEAEPTSETDAQPPPQLEADAQSQAQAERQAQVEAEIEAQRQAQIEAEANAAEWAANEAAAEAFRKDAETQAAAQAQAIAQAAAQLAQEIPNASLSANAGGEPDAAVAAQGALPDAALIPPVGTAQDFTALTDDETLDALVSPYLKKSARKPAQPDDAAGDMPEALPDAAFAPPEEPEIVLKESVREEVADLDDRDLKVSTRERTTYKFPSVDLLNDAPEETDTVTLEELEENKHKLLEKLRIYKIEVLKIEATVGPTVTLFELELAPDVKVSRIVALTDDLAMAMSARGIRIIAPIPGKNAVGVEIPNAKPTMVSIKSVLQSEKFKNAKAILPIAFGKTISNEIFLDDLAKMPHLLIAGATGSGKSVGINTILTSLIYFCNPEQVKLLLIDPKRVELFPYQKLKNHFLVKFKDLDEQIITDTSKAVYALKSVEKDMDMRYDRLAKAGVRNIRDYNAKFPDEAMPFIVVVIDELADMMITAGRDVEEPIARLAQLARAVGIHLVVATQRPSVDVITGVIKANFPARIAYQVASKIDSRTILDTMGADQLLGNGDMLYLPSGQPKPIRIQNAYVSTEEVERITDFIYSQEGFKDLYQLPAPDMKGIKSAGVLGELDDDEDGASSERDKMFDDAARMVVRHQQGSVSLLQRRLKLGFSRAARIMDQLEEYGIVGPPDGSKAREVLVTSDEALEIKLRDIDEP